MFGNPTNVFGWRYCSLLNFKFIYCKLTNALSTSLPKCSILLYPKARYSRKLISNCLVLYHLSRYLSEAGGTVLVILSIYLYLHSSDNCSSGQAFQVQWRLQMSQLTLDVHCSLIYQVVSRKVRWWIGGHLVIGGQSFLIKIIFGNLVTLRTYPDGGTEGCFLANIYNLVNQPIEYINSQVLNFVIV